MSTLTTLDGTPVTGAAFGTMQFGGNADAAASEAMFEAARAAGIVHFDTAFVYTDGAAERLLGRFARTARESLFIATKCAFAEGGRALIEAQVEESFARLGIDVIDLLYLHKWTGETLAEDIATLAGYVDAGRVRHIGVSNFSAWQTMKAAALAAGHGMRIAALQPMYNLVKRQAEVEILPMAAAEGFAVFPYSPLGGGLLTGKYAAGETGRLTTDDRYAARYRADWMHAAAGELAAIAAEYGTHPATLAVAWVARQPGVTGPILSARSAEQLRPSLDALAFRMDDALATRLSALAPTPPPATDRTEET
jgi:aryl-alcohol dehydrogenase-like predicted oxidoreductase